MQGSQRIEALMERPAERVEENQLEVEQGVVQTEVGSNEGGVTICISGAWSDTFLDRRGRRYFWAWFSSPQLYAPAQARLITSKGRAYPAAGC